MADVGLGTGPEPRSDGERSLLQFRPASRLPNDRELNDYLQELGEIVGKSEPNDDANLRQIGSWLELAVSEVDRLGKVAQEWRGTAAFLAHRINGDAGHRGVSSDALVATAVLGGDTSESPSDLGDLGRCCEAFAAAPYHLRGRMLPLLSKWTEERLADFKERGW